MTHYISPFVNEPTSNAPVLGQGFQASICKMRLHNGASSTAPQGPIKNSNTIVHFKVASELHQLAKEISVSLSASTPGVGNIPAITASLEASFKSSSLDSHLYAAIIVEQRDHQDILTEPHMTPNAQQLLETGDAEAFQERFGDSFISQIQYGKYLIAVLKIQFNKKESMRKFSESVKAESVFGSVGQAFTMIKNKSSEILSAESTVFASGNHQSWAGLDLKELEERINLHMTSDDAIVPTSYELKSYCQISQPSPPGKAILNQIEQQSERVKNFVELLQKYYTRLYQFINENNFVSRNSFKDKVNDPSFIEYKKKAKEAKKHCKTLEKLLNDLTDERIKDEEAINKIEKNELAATTKWYKENKKTLTELSNHALVHQIHFNKSNKKLEIKIPDNIKSETKYLFLQLIGGEEEKYEILKGIRFFEKSITTEKIMGNGCYIDVDITKLSRLKVSIPQYLRDKPIQLQIYAAQRIIGNNTYQETTNTVKKSLDRRKDGAMSTTTAHLLNQAVSFTPPTTANTEEKFVELEIRLVNDRPEDKEELKNNQALTASLQSITPVARPMPR